MSFTFMIALGGIPDNEEEGFILCNKEEHRKKKVFDHPKAQRDSFHSGG
jgi:hypothetical protein